MDKYSACLRLQEGATKTGVHRLNNFFLEEKIPEESDECTNNVPLDGITLIIKHLSESSKPLFYWVKILTSPNETMYGILKVSYNTAILFTMQGKSSTSVELIRGTNNGDSQEVYILYGKSKKKPVSFAEGKIVHMNNKTVMIGSTFEEEEFVTGRCFLMVFFSH